MSHLGGISEVVFEILVTLQLYLTEMNQIKLDNQYGIS
jgi:hypothetical protein